ncbi:muconolactone Delta-isomerase family protein [Streptomyces hokutonensis]|uniref:muconolactone Delta-isomerase family protein n=1 Tax=Streptomyces hokutonensis TaxID=1306990 RepID=UPI001FE1510E
MLHIWRCVGQYANISVFDVADNEALHQLLWDLPLFPYMSIEVTPPARHPSGLAADETSA